MPEAHITIEVVSDGTCWHATASDSIASTTATSNFARIAASKALDALFQLRNASDKTILGNGHVV